MKGEVEKREPSGLLDYIALAITTWGVGYIPGAPGTYGSAIGVGIYLAFVSLVEYIAPKILPAELNAIAVVLLTSLTLVGIWAASRAISFLGNSDPHEAVVDEVVGQLVVFLFLQFDFTIRWPFIFAGFLLFRVFDIWKPYPINDLQDLPGGLGIVADDLIAGIYAGICLAVGYAVYLSI